MMNKNYTAEICCGSFYDAKQAALGGAKRIELNSALMLGGLTPTISWCAQEAPGSAIRRKNFW